MYQLDWQISMEGKQLLAVVSVEITKSVSTLSDTATIKVPAMQYGSPLEGLKLLQKGQAITIQLGYNGNLRTEFQGYLYKVEIQNEEAIIHCEDGMYNFRRSVKNKHLLNHNIKKIAQHVIDELGLNYKISCNMDVQYDKFSIQNATAYDVLHQLQEDSAADIYLKEGVLHIHPVYQQKFGSVKYDTSINVEKLDLTYKTQAERKVWVEVESADKQGKKIVARAGSTGGDKQTVKIGGIKTLSELQKIANNLAKQKEYEGYEGSFTTWLVPYCGVGYSASLIDADWVTRNGTYYVTNVSTFFGADGAGRKIELGLKLS